MVIDNGTNNSSSVQPSQMSNEAENIKNKLLSQDHPDIDLLDKITDTMLNGSGEDQKKAEQILKLVKEDNDSWLQVDWILSNSRNNGTKYFALQILEELIKVRWKILQPHQAQSIKTYIVDQILTCSKNEKLLDDNRTLVNKLNLILIQILKHDWPEKWENFIGELIGSCHSSETVCENNMEIFSLLSEEIFDFSSESMTQFKAKHLKESMCHDFQKVFELCQTILDRSSNVQLIKVTLKALLNFLIWIPVGYIYETELADKLITRFLPADIFRNLTMSCLTEIMGIESIYTQQYLVVFKKMIQFLQGSFELNERDLGQLKKVYESGNETQQPFILQLALFLTTSLGKHFDDWNNLIDTPDSVPAPYIQSGDTILASKHDDIHDYMIYAFKLLLRISYIEDNEIFKICLEFWNQIFLKFFRITQKSPWNTNKPLYSPMVDVFNRIKGKNMAPMPQTVSRYRQIIDQARRLMIENMYKPEEVLVVENEDGVPVREVMRDTISVNIYNSMKETLVYSTNLDVVETEMLMLEKMSKQVNGSEWSWKNLNRLCWAIGSISGAMAEEDEKRFLVSVIKDLLGLCELKRGKENKAIIASNIMYVVGQYPRFLRAHWKFLKTVVTKLFEFMHESHEGVKDMACDTFLKISMKYIMNEIFDTILAYYKESDPVAKDAEVLDTLRICIIVWGNQMEAKISQFMDHVFEPTINMISKNYHEWPDHRSKFYAFLAATVKDCFQGLLQFSDEQLSLLLDTISWALKHTNREIGDLGLDILQKLLHHFIQCPEEKRHKFFKTYYLAILRLLFVTVTDSSLTSSLNAHAEVLAFMFQIVENNSVNVAFYALESENEQDIITQFNQIDSEKNQKFIKEVVGKLLFEAYDHLHTDQMRVIVEGFFSYDLDQNKFHSHLRDFLVETRQFQGNSVEGLFIDQKRSEQEAFMEKKKEMKRAIPGMMTPYEQESMNE
ncbi:hypothetical protein SNEBB_005482 [Seison nebaliae]|nr:hypothetical protein SNEBB_005482 [Seison nebaliae]